MRRLTAFLLLAIGFVFVIGLIGDIQFRHRSTALTHSARGHHHEHDHAQVYGHAHDHEQNHDQGHSGCCGGEEHNHVLDVLGQWETASYRNPLVEAYRFSKPSQFAASVVLAALFGIGLLLRIAGVDLIGLPREAAEATAAGEGRGVSSRCIVLVALAYVAVMSVLGVYVYFPPPGELFTQMTFHRANAILATKHNKCDYAIRELDAWDALAAKCVVSASLRGAPPSGGARVSVEELRERLARLREAIVEGRSDEEKKELSTEVMDAYSRCRKAFVEPRAGA